MFKKIAHNAREDARLEADTRRFALNVKRFCSHIEGALNDFVDSGRIDACTLKEFSNYKDKIDINNWNDTSFTFKITIK